ncbi:MAG TPA: hypothetical protein VN929_16655 [Burkholderiales bacterium]|nr:hypothetical protein [Burkholderiales bacterium]
MKASIAILAAIVLVLSWFLNAQRSEIAELTSKLNDKAAREGLEQQQKCALQAEKIFGQLGYKLNDPRSKIFASLQSHYSAKQNKCFMTVETTDMGTGTLANTKYLFDAFEQRGYAEYMWIADKVKKYWEVPPITCKLTPSSANERICKSEDEYKAFVATYME